MSTATFRSTLLCAAVLWLAGCAASGSNVQVTRDPNADLSKYNTYVFANSDPKQAGAIADPVVRRRIADIIAAQLAARGYQPAAQGQVPSLAVNFTGSTSQQQRTFMEGPGMGYYGYGWRQDLGGFDNYQYRQGTLVVDLVDPKTKDLVWRARVTEALSESYSDANWQKIEQSIAAAFKDLPQR
jgi:hypothetical protein